MRTIAMAAAAALVLGAGAAAQSGLPEGATLQTAVEGLEHPWALAFLPDGGLLVTEKPGRLRLVTPDGELVETPVAGTPEVLYSGQGGLLDVVLHPDFQTNSLVYLTWSEGDRRDNTLKLGRGRLEGGALTGFEEIFSAQPNRPTDVHYGARLIFLADNSILLGIGDAFDLREQAQRPGNHYGSFVRLSEAGTPFPPEVEGGAPGVYSYGHRNPQAVVVDPASGAIWAHEHGPAGGDEINRIEPGANYGWPIATRGVNYTGALVSPFETYPGMTDPVVDWTPSIAPAGMAFYAGGMFPEWEGDLLVAALIAGDAPGGSGHLRLVDLEGGGAVGQSIMLDDMGLRFRDVRVAPDGSVYALTDEAEGVVIRIAR
jgi:glucose/arabinose dehydrogenase